MKLKVVDLWIDSSDFCLAEYRPNDQDVFSIWINIRVGSDSCQGTNDYQLLVCTPEWIKKECAFVKSMWGRHLLIVHTYDFDLIKKMISEYVEGCTGETFFEIAEKISRVAAWEYEDYGGLSTRPDQQR